MARIPKTELEKLKQDVALERLVEGKGVKLKKHGQDLIGLCPFHDDREPSLVVSPKKNLWHCLGACQTGGSVIDWVMRSEGVSFRHAVELLREDSPSLVAELPKTRVGRPPQDGRGYIKTSSVTHLKAAVNEASDSQAALQQAIAYYHGCLKENPDALAYLEKRGLKSNELIERFKLGFCDRTLCYRLPKKSRKDGAEIRQSLQEVGILRESGHEHFRGSVVVPVFDESGQVVEVYGRKINDHLRPGTPYHLYLRGPHRGVWNLDAVKVCKEIILCEALLDAMTFWCSGYRNVTASYGVEGFTQDHLDAFERYGTERVLIAYDRDAAGDQAAEKLAARLGERGIACFRIQFPKGMDANAYAQQVKPASKSLGVAIRSATWLGSGKAPQVESAATELSKAEAPKSALAAAPAASSSAAEVAPADLAPSPLAAQPPRAEPEPESEVEEALPASPLPPMPRVQVEAEVKDQEVVLRFGDRRWRVRGLAKNMSYDVLRVNLLCSQGERFHVDTFDLYSARHRTSFVKQTADELRLEEEVLKKDLGRVLLKLEELQDEQIQSALNSKNDVPEMSEEERQAALALLRSPGLLDRIVDDFDRCGIVGEGTNKLCGYLAAVSRKLSRPLAVIIQSTSAAGKSSLMEAVLALMPSEDRVKYSAMTGQSLFYMGESDLKHKILAIVEEEGAERASYALKILQSEGELVIASTGKDSVTGRLVTQEYRVEGPVMIFLTTTAIDLDEELLNRCLVLSVDEAREQTRAIHRQQRAARTLDGLVAKQTKASVVTLHQNAQRLLRPMAVVNPFADALTFPDSRTRTRRDHEKYLTLIDTIALLHQHQRPVRKVDHAGESLEYVEVTAADIGMANRVAHEVLGRSLDELPPQTRRFLCLVSEMVGKACAAQHIDRGDFRFTRREVRAYTGFGNTQVKVHMSRLEELEYVLVHRGGRGQQMVYELLYEPTDGEDMARLSGLIDASKLVGQSYDGNRSGSGGEKSGSSRPQVGGISGGSRPAGNSPSGQLRASSSPKREQRAEQPLHRPEVAAHRNVPLAAEG